MALNTFEHFHLKEGWEAGVCQMACNTFLITLNNTARSTTRRATNRATRLARQHVGRGFKK
jgi:hypothetical protein